MAAVTLCQHRDLHLCRCALAAAAAMAAGHRGAMSLGGIPLADMMDRYYGYSVNPYYIKGLAQWFLESSTKRHKKNVKVKIQ